MKTIKVTPGVHTFDIDAMGHVSNISYIRWLEMARCQLMAACGMPVHELLDVGFGPALVRTEVDHIRPIHLGDEVDVSLWISEIGSASAWMDFEIKANDKVVAKARQRGLFVKLDSGRPHRLTDEQKGWFTPYLKSEPDA